MNIRKRLYTAGILWAAVAVSSAQPVVDTFIDFEAGNSGDIITSTLLNSCSHGNGTWHTEINLANANLSRAAFTNLPAPALPGPVIVAGTTYFGGGTRCVGFRRGDTFEAAVWAPSVGHSKICLGFWWNPGFAGTADFSWDDEVSMMAGSDFCVLSLEYDGNTTQVVKTHTQAGTSATAINIKPYLGVGNKTWFWVSMLFEAGALGKINIYTTNLVQIGSTSTLNIGGGQSVSEVHFGQHHGIAEPTSTSYYNDVIAAYDGNANFPLLPGPAGNVPPSITAQPQNKGVTAGSTATFSVTAGGTAPLTYQWKWQGTNVTGATASSWTTPALALVDDGDSVQVGVTNAYGGVLSSLATLSVTNGAAPTITTQPTSKGITAGQTTFFGVVATGAPLTYQWKWQGTNISGATASSWTTPALSLANDGDTFQVGVTNAWGGVLSTAVTVAVTNGVPPTVTSQPQNQSVSAGQSANFTVSCSGATPMTYQWQWQGTNVSGASASSWTTPALSMANDGDTVQVAVNNTFGGTVSSAATLDVVSNSAGNQIIIDDHATVWQGNVGVRGGVPSVQTIYTTLSAGSTAAQINSAIASCPSNQVVKLGPGTFTISSFIDLKTGVVLRGSGRGVTFLNYTGSEIQGMRIRGSSTQNPPSGSANWTGGYTRGSTSITLDNVANLGPRTIMILGQLPDTDIVEPNGTEPADYSGMIKNPSFVQQQQVFVTGVSGNTVSFTPPLMFTNWTSSLSPKAYWLGNSTCIKKAGFEDFTFDNSSGNASYSFLMQDAVDCWIKNVESISGYLAHVYTLHCVFDEIRDSYFHVQKAYGTASYGIYTLCSSSFLIENNLLYEITGPIRYATSAGTVIAYNYINWPRYDSSPGWLNQGIKSHGGHCYLNLIEGNVTPSIYFDYTHGSSSHNLVFRNRSFGWDTNMTANVIPVVCDAWNRWENIVGNVLGRTGVQTAYNRASGGNDNAIYCLGYTNTSRTAATLDSVVPATTLRHANYDTVNRSIVYDPNIPTTTLNNSYYLASKPSWFGNLPWPPINPASPSDSPAVIPAGYFFVNGVYPSGGGGTPPGISSQPQSVVRAVGQTATFRVTASGDTPLTYQWKWFGTNVNGATGTSWTSPAVLIGQNGSSIAVGVTNPYGGILSSAATLTVRNRPLAPTNVRVAAAP